MAKESEYVSSKHSWESLLLYYRKIISTSNIKCLSFQVQAYQGGLGDISQLYKIRYKIQLDLYKDANKYNLQLYFFAYNYFVFQ